MDINKKRRRRRVPHLATLMAAATLGLAACGGGDPTATVAASDTAVPTTAAPAAQTETTAPAVEAAPAEEKTEDPAPDEESLETTAAKTIEDVAESVIRIEAAVSWRDVGDLSSYESGWTGSGVIIDADGLALTNYHVAGATSTLNVTGGGIDGTVNARVVAVSECSDLAVIDLEGSGYEPLALLQETPSVGLRVFSAGYPGGGEYTVTGGIVSSTTSGGESAWASVDGVIAHDARIRGGNSGGPLVDEQANVVGINYAGNDYTDENFAIDLDLARRLIDTVGEDTAKSLGINGVAANFNGRDGVWAHAIESGSPADDAGLEAGDLIVTMEGLPIGTDGTLETYCDVIASHLPTDTITIEVHRPETSELLVGQLNGDPLVSRADYPLYDVMWSQNGFVSISLPTEWSDRRTAGYDLAAGTSLVAFENGWTTPAVVVTDTPSSIASVADNMNTVTSRYGACTRGTGSPYVSFTANLWSIQWEKLTNCPDGAEIFVASMRDTAVNVGDWFTVEVQSVSSRDEEAFFRILRTMTAQ